MSQASEADELDRGQTAELVDQAATMLFAAALVYLTTEAIARQLAEIDKRRAANRYRPEVVAPFPRRRRSGR